MAGVGIFFKNQEHDAEKLYVHNITKGGSADREGSVQVSDRLLSVDGQPVFGSDRETLRNLILGEKGTFVTLQFVREQDGELFQYSVSLMRGNAAYFSQLKEKNNMQVGLAHSPRSPPTAAPSRLAADGIVADGLFEIAGGGREAAYLPHPDRGGA